ncbi:NADH-quinone oxidoreductase subunit D-related protein [Aristophania vespae]|nr:hypothetical protein [Aristophania vespae]
MSGMSQFLRKGQRIGLSHYLLESEDWTKFLSLAGRPLPLLACWADEEKATILLLEGESPVLVSTPISLRRYYAPSSHYPVASWGERIARDLWGVEALYASDDAPILDDGSWTQTWPLSKERLDVQGGGLSYPQCLHISPHCTTLPGLVGLNYELKHGYIESLTVDIASAHRGIISQLQGLTPKEALPLISRISAGGFVAHPLAFIRAYEQAQGIYPPPYERDTRLILLEIERVSLHLFDLAQTARFAKASLFATYCDQTREIIASLCSAHGMTRRLTDMIELKEGDHNTIEIVPLAQSIRDSLASRLDMLRDLYQLYASRFKNQVILSNDTAWRYAIGGVIGRASGRYIDMRRGDVGMRLEALRSSGGQGGDAHGRNLQRLTEIRDSLALISEIIANFGVEDATEPFAVTQEGIGVVEGARGDIWYWLVMENDRIKTLQIRDPALAVMTAFNEMFHGLRPDQLPFALTSLGFSPAAIAL